MRQHGVADRVAMAVVDRLEVIDVEDQQGRHRAVALAAQQFVREAVHEGAPVDEAGQGVGRREYAQVGLERDAPRDLRLHPGAFGLAGRPLRARLFLVAPQRDLRPEHACGNQDGGDREANGEGRGVGAGSAFGAAQCHDGGGDGDAQG